MHEELKSMFEFSDERIDGMLKWEMQFCRRYYLDLCTLKEHPGDTHYDDYLHSLKERLIDACVQNMERGFPCG
jgi:hypothetical protein